MLLVSNMKGSKILFCGQLCGYSLNTNLSIIQFMDFCLYGYQFPTVRFQILSQLTQQKTTEEDFKKNVHG